MAKRRARKRIGKQERDAARLIRDGWKTVGKDKRESAATLRKNLEAGMASAIQRSFVSTDPRTGRARTMPKREAARLARRFSLAGLTGRIGGEKARRDFVRDRRGVWHSAKTGLVVSGSNMDRSRSLMSYWTQVKIIAQAQGVTIAEARRAIKIVGEEAWETLIGDTPRP